MKKLLLFILLLVLVHGMFREFLIEEEIKKSQDADFIVMLLGSSFLFHLELLNRTYNIMFSNNVVFPISQIH